MEAKEITQEMQLINDLNSEVRRLRGTMEAMMIKAAGITELEGDNIEIYQEAESIVERRTQWAITDRIRRKEILRLESEIGNLRRQADEIRQDLGSSKWSEPSSYIQFTPQTYTVGTGIAVNGTTATVCVPKEYYGNKP